MMQVSYNYLRKLRKPNLGGEPLYKTPEEKAAHFHVLMAIEEVMEKLKNTGMSMCSSVTTKGLCRSRVSIFFAQKKFVTKVK